MDDPHCLKADGDDAPEQIERVAGIAHGLVGIANNLHLKWRFETLRLNRSKRLGLQITC